MRLAYVDLMRQPNIRAHGIAIRGMCKGYHQNGVEVHRYHPNRYDPTGRGPWWYNKWYRLLYSYSLSSRAMLGGYDLYHTRSPQCAMWLPRDRTIMEIHMVPTTKLRLNWSKFKLVVVTTEHVRQAMGSPSNSIVEPSAVDLDDFKDVDPIKNDGPTVGYVGSLSSCKMDKGVGMLREAMKGVDATLKVVTSLPRHEAIRHMCGCDVLVLPYANNRMVNEGSPLKLYEYMASGVPVVASFSPGTANIKNIWKYTNPMNLRYGIKSILKGYINGKRLSKLALQEVKHYTWNNRASRILASINSVSHTA